MARESAGHTRQVTGLVHEAYLELFADDVRTWENRAHSFGYAATVMRHILVRHAKRKRADKRGGDSVRTTLDGLQTPGSDPIDLIALDEALTRPAKWDQRKARCTRWKERPMTATPPWRHWSPTFAATSKGFPYQQQRPQPRRTRVPPTTWACGPRRPVIWTPLPKTGKRQD